MAIFPSKVQLAMMFFFFVMTFCFFCVLSNNESDSNFTNQMNSKKTQTHPPISLSSSID